MDEAGVRLTVVGDWDVRVEAREMRGAGDGVVVDIAPPSAATVTGERHAALPLFNPNEAGWKKGARLAGVTTQETSAKGMLDPDSLWLVTADGAPLAVGTDYQADLEWGAFGRLPGGRLGETQSVVAGYRHGLSRIDALVVDGAGRVRVRAGVPHISVPRPPPPAEGERTLAHVWIPGRLAKLGADNLFPILETNYPEPPAQEPCLAEVLLPRTLGKLRRGEPLRLLAWGDSVTDAGYLPSSDERWQAQLAARLRNRFPRAHIDPMTRGWGGRTSRRFLDEPPGSPYNYREQILGARPDVIVSEFVNDAYLTPEGVEELYGRFLTDFRSIGAEWLILTPHYVRPDWMGLTRERDVDDDPRPYVTGLHRFADRRGVALADAARRWGRLWRQGIPYTTLLLNCINHPDARGMRLYADSAMPLFGRGAAE